MFSTDDFRPKHVSTTGLCPMGALAILRYLKSVVGDKLRLLPRLIAIFYSVLSARIGSIDSSPRAERDPATATRIPSTMVASRYATGSLPLTP